MATKPLAPYAESKIARYLAKQIDAIASEKSQREIAAEIGYDKPNMLSMIKRGESKLPLEKVPLMAKALHVDTGHLMRLAMEQYWPNMHEAIRDSFGYTVTKNEYDIVAYLRELTGDADPRLTDDLKRRLTAAFKTNSASEVAV